MLENGVQRRSYTVPDWNADLSPVRSPDIVSIFGARIANLTYEDGLAAVSSLMDRRRAALRAAPETVPTATLFFCNANTLTFTSSSAGYRDILNSADLLFGDGTGVRMAALMRGVAMKGNLNGTDLVPDLLQHRKKRGDKVFMLGGEEAANRTASEYFQRTFSGATLAGRHHGFMSDADSAKVVDEINEAQPDLLLVGMGHPRQEQWIAAHASELKVPLTIAVGGLFAYWGNGLKRASQLSRRLGLEWFEIMCQQPQKVRRYLVGSPIFLAHAALTVASDRRIMHGDQSQ